jgi:hypothetical protein
MEVEKFKTILPKLGCVSCQDLETLHLAADGNFKLNRVKKKSHAEASPRIQIFYSSQSLNASRMDQDSFGKLGCESSLNAAKPILKSERFDEKGVIGLFCARHGAPLLFIDCFTGERYAYIDLLLQEYLETQPNCKNVFFYYDVNCLYAKHYDNHKERMFLFK